MESAHWIYRVRTQGRERIYEDRRPFRSEGKLSPCHGLADGPWQATARELLTRQGYDPDTHHIVFDVWPDAPNLHLYRLDHLWGFVRVETTAVPHTDDAQPVTWSPILLQLEALFRDGPPLADPEESKKRFRVSGEERPMVLEFLYQKQVVYRNRSAGVWRWGKTGRMNAALLFGDAGRHVIAKAQSLIEGN